MIRYCIMYQDITAYMHRNLPYSLVLATKVGVRLPYLHPVPLIKSDRPTYWNAQKSAATSTRKHKCDQKNLNNESCLLVHHHPL